MGYHRAGFSVTGVDIKPQPHYPFPFIQGDALEYVREHGHEYDAIHASPPCQGYSRLRQLPWLKDREYQMLIPETRRLLRGTGEPWVIENVYDAPLYFSSVLCGLMFNLPLYRHRRFESSEFVVLPEHPKHKHVISPGRMLGSRYSAHGAEVTGVLNHSRGGSIEAARKAMGIDWMSTEELRQAIPPAYTEWIGKQLLRVAWQAREERK
jgi:DNA (cytosine-5)-methyltransferase 1